MDCDEPHMAPNEKTQPIQWTERATNALVAPDSFCPALATAIKTCEVEQKQEPAFSLRASVTNATRNLFFFIGQILKIRNSKIK
jgi:hypothetical protein